MATPTPARTRRGRAKKLSPSVSYRKKVLLLYDRIDSFTIVLGKRSERA